jgi:cell division protein FtsA
MHLLSVEADVVRNLVHCLKRCDVEVAGLAAPPMSPGSRRWSRTSRNWARR